MVSDRQSAEYVIPTELKSFGLIAVLTLTVLGIVYLLRFRDVDGVKEVDSGSGKPIPNLVPLLLLVAPLLVKLLGLRMIQFTKKIYMPLQWGVTSISYGRRQRKKGIIQVLSF